MLKMIFIILIINAIVFNAFGQDAKEIIKKVDDKLQGSSNISEMTMSIIRPNYTRTIGFKNWSQGREYFMTYISSPAKEKGQVFMKFKSEMWNYMPSINRMIKLPPSMMSQGWMGSDYTNDDLVKQSSIVNDYDQKIITSETIDSHDCYKIEMIPHPEANVVWGKILTWVDKDRYIMLKTEYYDQDNLLVRTELGKEVKVFDSREIPSVIEILPADDKGNKTVLTIEKMQFNVKIDPSFFSQQNMKRIR